MALRRIERRRRDSYVASFRLRPSASGNETPSFGWVSIAVVLVFLSAKLPRAQAVILPFVDASTNTTAPDDDPGWNNVGVHGGGAGIYLGNRWVITANHLNRAETITFNGIPVPVESGSEITLSNPDGMGLSPLTDLRLVRLAEAPDLPGLEISATTPPVDSEVLMIGRGRDRQEDLTMWTVSSFGGELRWEETDLPPFDRSGYKWLPTQTMRWGTNFVEDDLAFDRSETDLDHNVISDLDDIDVVAFVTRLDEFDATPFEAHATLGDSGGGVFFDNDGQWELAGVMVAVGVSDGQPEHTSVFSNFTVSADLSSYRDQIEAIIRPELQPGDANQDLSFDQFDLVQVAKVAKYRTGQPATWGEGDWNGAPGGYPGNPPRGDGLYNQFDIIASQRPGIFRTGPYAATTPDQLSDPTAATAVTYDAQTGALAIEAPPGVELTSISIQSEAAIFTADAAENLGGLFDVDSDETLFKATFGSTFDSIRFGTVARAGLTEEFLLNDLSFDGSRSGGGELGEVMFVFLPVPEPSAIVLLALGGLVWGTWCHGRKPRSRSS